jgi:F0F1-type ATP synthase assembly protein I
MKNFLNKKLKKKLKKKKKKKKKKNKTKKRGRSIVFLLSPPVESGSVVSYGIKWF